MTSKDISPSCPRAGDMPSSYDRVLYPGHAYQETHPDRLATMGTLYGVDPPAVENCRVLEIGCSEGSNLIPMAVGLPKSEFIGIDLAAKPIERAQAIIDRTGLRNIRVRTMDLMAITPEFGHFDYIIAHGFYSWVPEQVQEKLLAVCSQNLSAHGVAFVSYNAYPGAHVRQASRDLMLFHLDQLGEASDPVRQGRDILKFMVESVDEGGIWKPLLQDEYKRVCKRDDNFTYHDELNPNYSPTYFSKFIDSANRHGLQFLSEAKLRDMINPPIKPDTLQVLNKLAKGDLIGYHQYLDFLLFQGFRRTLLCQCKVHLQRDELAERVTLLWVASPLKESSAKTNNAVQFVNHRGPGTIETNSAVMIAALQRLEEIWPQGECFGDLLRKIIPRVPTEQRSEARAALAESVLRLASSSLLDLRTYRLPLARTVSDRPITSPLTRMQAEEGNLITTVLHTHVEIKDQQTRRVLQLLDGTRDHRELVRSLVAEYPDISRETVNAQVNSTLTGFYRMGLLVA